MDAITRRTFLGRLAAAGAAGAAVGGGSVLTTACQSSSGNAPQLRRFSTPLPVPPELRPVRSDQNADYYELAQRAAQVDVYPGRPTTIWGYNGLFPGPTIRVRSGRTAVVRHTNQLQSHTVVHLHGGMTPASSDGFPTDMIMPGTAKDYEYPNGQPAATLWYHDHAMDHTGENVYMGLAGLYIVEDDVTDNLPLPRGEFDVPLIIQGRQFGPDGQLVFKDDADSAPSGVVLVNGAPWPRLDVARRRYRLRILNATNAHFYRLALSTNGPFDLVATDGGLLPAPVQLPEIVLGEAERAEVVLDFSLYPVGTTVTLLDKNSTGDAAAVMAFAVVRDARDDSTVPAALGEFQPIPQQQATRTRRFNFFNKGINGEKFNPDHPIATTNLDDTEIWTLHGDAKHTAHLHLVQFQVLDRGGKAPDRSERGWKDTVRLGQDVRVITRFTGYRGRYLLHCHNLPHEDHGMMARYDVA